MGLAVTAVPGAGAASHRPVSVLKTYSFAGSAYFAVAVDSVRHLAYVAGSEAGGHVDVINTRTNKSTFVSAPGSTNTIALDEKTGLVYIPDGPTNAVAVLKGASLVATIALPSGSTPADATIDQKTGTVYVDDTGSASVSVINGTTLDAPIAVGGYPYGGAADPVSGDVYIPNYNDGTVSVIHGATVIATVPTGMGAHYVAVDPTRHLAYTTSFNQQEVWVIHGSTLLGKVPAGSDPYGVAVNSATHLAYVSNYNSNTVSILNGTTVKATVPVGDQPSIPAVDLKNGLTLIPSEEDSRINAFVGTKLITQAKTIQAGNAFVGIDTSNGRAFASSFTGSAITELQTPGVGRISITSPKSDHYKQGATVAADFACKAGANNIVTSCRGSSANHQRLSTSKLGVHRFSVTLRPRYGASTVKTVTYHVVKR